MVKYLPISYPHQCTYRDSVSKRYCNFQGRCFKIECQGHWNNFPEDCPLTTEKNSEDNGTQPTIGNTARQVPGSEQPSTQICPNCDGRKKIYSTVEGKKVKCYFCEGKGKTSALLNRCAQ